MTPSTRGVCLSLLTAALVAGCAVGPDFHTPAPPATSHYTRAPEPTGTVAAPGASGTAQTFSSERDIPADWWTLYHSSSLDGLVREALADSPTVQAAQATLLTAVETWKANRGGLLLPAVDATGSATRERVPGAAFGEPNIPGTIFNLFDASVGVTYRLDLFGASRRQVEAFHAQADYQRWEFEAARLTLTAN
ncbi:MAG TPA: TolC family protein, partial [Steroidobacteraceae bacterium]|nr:TolC family protein [Steroidobacteraceae bacterium]